MNSENCLSARISSAVAKQQKAFLQLPADSTWTTAMFGFYDSPSKGWTIIFLRGEGAGQFPKTIPAQQKTLKKTSCKGRHGKKIGHVLSALQLLFLMLSPKNTMHNQEEVKKKNNHALKNYPYFPPQKKWFVFCHVVIMKGYSQFAS